MPWKPISINNGGINLISKFIGRAVMLVLKVLFSLLNNRWYTYQKIDKSVVFCAEKPGLISILYPNNVSIGEHTVINANTHINAEGDVSIGRYVHVGRGLTIYSSNHNYRSQKSIPYDHENVKKSVMISDFVWIGANVSIVPGIRIGEGSIVGIGAVVSRDVPAGAIVAGNPAVIIGYRDMCVFNQLKTQKSFC